MPDQHDSIRVSRNRIDLSLDLYQLFKSGYGDVMLRIRAKDGNAIRIALSGALNGRNFEADTLNPLVYTERYGQIGIRSGYEWGKTINRSVFYYGCDVGLGYSYQKVEWTGAPLTEVSPHKNYSIAITPFFGLGRQIFSKVFLSLEIGVEASMHFLRSSDPATKRLKIRDNSLGVGILPLRFINLSYTL